jgi:fructose-specific component phosphotransferase system IIB-like protein
MKTMKTELSPAAQAVLDAYIQGLATKRLLAIAAALRAAADQCKIEWNYHPDYPETELVIVVSDLLTIASELEGQP